MLNITQYHSISLSTKLKVTVVQKRFLAFSIIPANYAFQVFHDGAERKKCIEISLGLSNSWSKPDWVAKPDHIRPNLDTYV